MVTQSLSTPTTSVPNTTPKPTSLFLLRRISPRKKFLRDTLRRHLPFSFATMHIMKGVKQFLRLCLTFLGRRSPGSRNAPMTQQEEDLVAMFTPQDEPKEESEDQRVIGPYILCEKIGSGAFGSVHLCEHKHTQKRYAGKLFKLSFAREDENIDIIYNEVEVLKSLSHDNTISFVDLIYSPFGVLLVMDLVIGIDLYDLIPEDVGIVESFARVVFLQLINALKYLHGKRIIHRDVKIENVMIDNRGTVKLVDYGLAEEISKERAEKDGLMIYGRCGTQHCYAPEVICCDDNDEEFEGDKVDIWAAGVFLYSMVSGKRPFRGSSREELTVEITNLHFQFDDVDFSPELEDLLCSIFKSEPANRASMEEILGHPWSQGVCFDETNKVEFTSPSGKVKIDLTDVAVEKSMSCPKIFCLAEQFPRVPSFTHRKIPSDTKLAASGPEDSEIGSSSQSDVESNENKYAEVGGDQEASTAEETGSSDEATDETRLSKTGRLVEKARSRVRAVGKLCSSLFRRRYKRYGIRQVDTEQVW